MPGKSMPLEAKVIATANTVSECFGSPLTEAVKEEAYEWVLPCLQEASEGDLRIWSGKFMAAGQALRRLAAAKA